MFSSCALCKSTSALRDSHVLPEFLYRELYDNKHRFSGITGVGTKGRSLLQKGLRERLLCDDCEQFFNDSFEKPFLANWIDSCPLPEVWKNEDSSIDVCVDYTNLKLFHISVIFRMSVSTIPSYNEVDLGPYTDVFRDMLLKRDPGLESDFPIFGFAVFDSRTKNIRRDFVSRPRCYRLHKIRIIEIVYGGMWWHLCITKGKNRHFEDYPLQHDGNFHIEGIDWRTLGVTKEAASLLNG